MRRRRQLRRCCAPADPRCADRARVAAALEGGVITEHLRGTDSLVRCAEVVDIGLTHDCTPGHHIDARVCFAAFEIYTLLPSS